MIRELERKAGNGLLVGFLFLAVAPLLAYGLVQAGEDENAIRIVAFALAWVVWGIGMGGFFMVQPNQAKVLTLFGEYAGW